MNKELEKQVIEKLLVVKKDEAKFKELCEKYNLTEEQLSSFIDSFKSMCELGLFDIVIKRLIEGQKEN